MLQPIKNSLRKFLFIAGIDLTKNQQYDRQTLAIMKKVLKKDSNCIDVGCHKGEVMDEMIKLAPEGHHYGFEPIPEYHAYLLKKYQSQPRIHILKKALSDSNGQANFHWVKNAPAYSGLQQRSYAVKNPVIEKIEVDLSKLDDSDTIFPPIALMKIDVEGAEMKVLNGARQFIQQHQPVVVFECGMGAADHYGVEPEQVAVFFEEIKYALYTLKGFLQNSPGLTRDQFCDMFRTNTEYYFVASPAQV